MKTFNQHNSRRKGSILPLFALSITVLLGAAALAVDYAVLLADKNHLQRACDAAALAGAGYLKRSDDTTDTAAARNQAIYVAEQNNLAPGEVTASSITFLDSNTKIRVAATRARSLFFARIFGMTTGNVRASATAKANPAAGPPVPIAITPVSKARYQNDGDPHVFTLVRPQVAPFATNYTGITAFDPFTVFDLSGASSPTQMRRQLEGDLTNPVSPQLGYMIRTMSTGAIESNFEGGIAARLLKAAGSPWFDPATGILPASSAWRMVGTRYSDVLSGNIAPNNPRIVRFIIINEINDVANGGNLVPVVDFASAYLHSVQYTPTGALSFTATFLPAGTGSGSATVELVD